MCSSVYAQIKVHVVYVLGFRQNSVLYVSFIYVFIVETRKNIPYVLGFSNNLVFSTAKLSEIVS